MSKLWIGGGVAATLSFAIAASAQTPPGNPDYAAVFGARPSVEQISLSPDGQRVAYIVPRAGQGSALYTVDIGTGTSRVTASTNGDPERLDRCDWVSNQRLACRIYAVVKGSQIVPVSRLVAIDVDGKNFKLLSQNDSVDQYYGSTYGGSILDFMAGEAGEVLMDRWFVPEVTQTTRLANDKEGYGVVRVNTRNANARTVEEPVRYAVEYLTDGLGTVRIMGVQQPGSASGYSGDKIRYSYRTSKSTRWQPLGELDVLSNEGLNPYAIDGKLNAVYAMKKLNGRQALYRLSLDGSLREELVFAHDEVDADAVLRIGRSRRPVGVSYVTDRRQAVYFDPALTAIAGSLGKAMPNLPLIRFVDSSVDESKLLVWAGSDTDPGRYFIYDRSTRQLNEIMLVRPQLEHVQLATMKAVTYRAADGTNVPAYLTLPPNGAQKGLPAIVMPHGGPSARDEWGFDWLAQYFAMRGYAVLQPNFRGSAGYGDSWFEKNGFQSWRSAIGDVNDAGRWLIAEGIADPSKVAVIGWSYGGYAALQSAAVDPNLFKAVVAIAPVTDLPALKEESRGWSHHALASKFIGSGPHLNEGSPAQNANRINAPVLMFHGDTDRNVTVAQSRRMADRLRDAGKSVELVVYPKLDHYLEDSQARTEMLRKSDAFLRSAMRL